MRIVFPFYCSIYLATMLAVPFASALGAQPIELASRIEAVTVFPDGAAVSRVADIDIGTGASELLFENLPNDLDATSLRVSGIAGADLAIDSVFSRLTPAVKRPDDTIVAQLKDLRSEREAVQAAIESIEAKRGMAFRFAKSDPKELASDSKPLAIGDWSQAFDTLATTILKTGEEIRAERAKARELDASIKRLEEAAVGAGDSSAPRLEVHVQVHAAAALKGRLTLTYRVSSAGWRPVYDVRLDTGNATRQPSLDLVRRASVAQSTGEDWQDVVMTLSTTRARRGTAAPQMDTQRLAFFERPDWEERKSERGIDSAPRTAAMPQPAPPPPTMAQVKVAVRQTEARVEGGEFQATFVIPDHVSLASDSTNKTFTIVAHSVNPDLVIKTVPALDQTAYLETRFANAEETPLLPGEASLYRNGNYIGTGTIGFVAQGDNVELGFGADDRVKVTRLPVKRKENEPFWLGQSKTETREFKTTVKNLHDFPVKIAVVDQIPISENTAITVEQLQSTTAPTDKIVADKRGVMGWTYDYAPGQARDIVLAYRMKWPSDREVVTEPVPTMARQ